MQAVRLIVALTIEKRRDQKSIWIGSVSLTLFFFLSWSIWKAQPLLTRVCASALLADGATPAVACRSK
jgi:hypothetical protein